MTAPDRASGISLAFLTLMAGIGAVGVIAIETHRGRSRFLPRPSRAVMSNRRGERAALGASAVLAGLILGLVTSSQLGAFAAVRVNSSSHVTSAPQASPASSPAAAVQIIGSTSVTTTKPVPLPTETFHLATGPIIPARLRIPSIGVDSRVEKAGLGGDGSMGVPDNLWTSSWLSSGPRPGQAGKSVIAGHRGIGTPGLFGHLEKARAGDRIYVSDPAGGELVFEITRVASLDLSHATQVAVFGPTAQQQLILVTCYGKFQPSTGTYDRRLVVFSRLITPAS